MNRGHDPRRTERGRRSRRRIAKLGRDGLLALLRRHAGCVREVARELRATRMTVYNYLRRYGLRGELEALARQRPKRPAAPKPRARASAVFDVEGGRFTEQEAARALIDRHYGCMKRMAEDLGTARQHLYRLIARLGLSEYARRVRRVARSTYDF